MTVVAITLALVLVSLGAGCSRHDEPREDDRPAATVPADTGVAECDEYIARYEACVEKGAVPARESARQALRAQRESFKAAPPSPRARAAMKRTCRRLLDGLAQNAACK
jgi:hypothetical protein